MWISEAVIGAAKGVEGRWGKEADLDALKEVLEQRAVDARQPMMITHTQQLQETDFSAKQLHTVILAFHKFTSTQCH